MLPAKREKTAQADRVEEEKKISKRKKRKLDEHSAFPGL